MVYWKLHMYIFPGVQNMLYASGRLYQEHSSSNTFCTYIYIYSFWLFVTLIFLIWNKIGPQWIRMGSWKMTRFIFIEFWATEKFDISIWCTLQDKSNDVVIINIGHHHIKLEPLKVPALHPRSQEHPQKSGSVPNGCQI